MALSAGGTTQIDATVNEDAIQSARISDTQMLAAYFDGGTTLGARVLDINTAAKSLTPNAQSDIAWTSGITEFNMAELVVPTKYIVMDGRFGRAAVLNVSGTTVTAGAVSSTNFSTIAQANYLLSLTSSTALRCWKDGSSRDITLAVLSVDGSDNVTQGAKLLAVDLVGGTMDAFAPIMFTPSVGAIFFEDSDDNFHLKAQLFTISGATASKSGGFQTLYTARDGWNTSSGTVAAALSSSECAVAHNIDNGSNVEEVVFHVVSLAGSTLSVGATLQLDLTETPSPGGNGVFTNETTVLFPGDDSISGDVWVVQLIKDGTTLSYTASDFINIPVTGANIKDSIVKIVDDFALICTEGSYDGTVLGSDIVVKNYSWVLGGGQP